MLPQTDFSFNDTSFDYNVVYDYTVSAIDSAGLRSNLALPVNITYNKLDLLKQVTDFNAAFDSKQKGILLNWNYKADANYFYIIYRGMDGQALTPFRSLDKKENEFIDYKVEKGKVYRYAIQIKQENNQLESKLSLEKEVTIPK